MVADYADPTLARIAFSAEHASKSASKPVSALALLESYAMGRRLNLFCLVVTMTVTLVTTVIIGVTVLSDYWEVIHYSREIVDDLVQKAGGNFTVESMYDGRVIIAAAHAVNGSGSGGGSSGSGGGGSGAVISAGSIPTGNDSVLREKDLLVQLHGGLWSLCLDLTGKGELGQTRFWIVLFHEGK